MQFNITAKIRIKNEIDNLLVVNKDNKASLLYNSIGIIQLILCIFIVIVLFLLFDSESKMEDKMFLIVGSLMIIATILFNRPFKYSNMDILKKYITQLKFILIIISFLIFIIFIILICVFNYDSFFNYIWKFCNESYNFYAFIIISPIAISFILLRIFYYYINELYTSIDQDILNKIDVDNTKKKKKKNKE